MPMVSHDDYDLEVAARTILGEAGGEGEQGQIRVAHVLARRTLLARYLIVHRYHNRILRHPLYGTGKVSDACTVWNQGKLPGQRIYQFSCWAKSSPVYNRITQTPATDPELTALRDLAARVCCGHEDQSYTSADHYCRTDWIARTEWARGQTPCDVYGRHSFFNLEHITLPEDHDEPVS
jgi:spore germination cell wall hydrolase CwlJ-like protein